jgi:hypothetical protein
MSSCLQLVSEQFPDIRDRVVWLFARDPLFRELCEDYEACSVALARQASSEGLQREYAALRLRLETELLRFLNEDARARDARLPRKNQEGE